MTCREARALAIENARCGCAVPDPHFATCAECARFLRAQQALRAAFAVLSREAPAPPDLEARLLYQFDARRAARPVRWALPAAAALAAALALAAIVMHRPAATPRLAAEPFIEIPYIAPLAPYERASIVRMDVPVSALIAAGFDVHATDTGAALRVDVLFGQDGRAHAIRPVSDSNSDRRVIQ